MRRREFITLVTTGVTVWPLAVRAQRPVTPVIGFLATGSADSFGTFLVAFREGLRETGFVEGENIKVEFRWADAHLDRLRGLARELVARRVAVIVGVGGSVSALAAKAETLAIPIVFTTASDPVADGLVASLNRPGGNITGVTVINASLVPKCIELLSELAPNATVIGMLLNPAYPGWEHYVADVQSATRSLGRQVHIVNASGEHDLEAAFTILSEQRIGALVVLPDPFFNRQRDQIVALAARHAIATIYDRREFVTAGGLMSYGANLGTGYRQAGIYTGRILQGAKPADLPVVQPTTFELVINLKTARALGLTIPPNILARANEVLE